MINTYPSRMLDLLAWQYVRVQPKMRMGLAIIALLFFYGCQDDVTLIAPKITPPLQPLSVEQSIELSGLAMKGAIKNATVTLYDVQQGRKDQTLGSAMTDANGQFDLVIKKITTPIIIEVQGGLYIDEATGKTIRVPLAPEQGLFAAIPSQFLSTAQPITISPLTTFAYFFAKNQPPGFTDTTINLANRYIETYFDGIDILLTRPINPAINFGIANENSDRNISNTQQLSINYGMVLAGLSQLAKQWDLTNPYELIQALNRDISDSLFDGQLNTVTLRLSNNIQLTEQTMQGDLADAILAFSNDPILNLSQTQASDTLLTKLRSSNSTQGPQNIVAMPKDSAVTLSWNPVDADTVYNIYYNDDENIPLAETLPIQNVQSPYTITELINNTTYYFVITALNTLGTEMSGNVTSATPRSSTLPTTPTQFNALADNQSVTLNWAVIEGLQYTLYYDTLPSINLSTSQPLPAVTPPYTLSGLSNETQYYFMLTAHNGSQTNQAASLPTPVITATPRTPATLTEQPAHHLFATTAIPLPLKPISISLADLNNDQQKDLIVAGSHFSTNQILIKLATPPATFQADKIITIQGKYPTSHQTADLDGNGYLDIVSVGGLDNINIIFNERQAIDTTRQFLNLSQDTMPNIVAIFDIDNNQTLDIVTGNLSMPNLAVIRGIGNGTFLPPTYLLTDQQYIDSILPIDINNNDLIDMIVANPNNPQIITLLNQGNGVFAEKIVTNTVDKVLDLASGHLNADDYLDLVAAHPNSISILLNNGDNTFKTLAQYQTGEFPKNIRVRDLNNDNILDIITANQRSADASILLGNPKKGNAENNTREGNGTFQHEFRLPLPSTPVDLALHDINNDSLPDAFFAISHTINNRSLSQVSVFFGKANGTLHQNKTLMLNDETNTITSADYNNDGMIDLATANQNKASLSILLATPARTITHHTTLPLNFTPRQIASANMDADNNIDLITISGEGFGDSICAVHLGNGDGSFQLPTKYSFNGPSTLLKITDLNGDTINDVITAGSIDHINIRLGNGDGKLSPPIEHRFANNKQPVALAIADINNDSIPDIVTANQLSQDILLLAGEGNGQFSTYDIIQFTDYTPTQIALIDIDLNGSTDMLVTSQQGRTIQLSLFSGFQNTITPIETHISQLSGIPTAIQVADINNDALYDIIIANKAKYITLLLGTTSRTFSPPQHYATQGASSLVIEDINQDTWLDIITVGQTKYVSLLLNPLGKNVQQ